MVEVDEGVSRTVSRVNELSGKYLTFSLDREEYGLEILKVREIIGLMDITAVPRTPSYIRGVINLRGKVIPVVDLRVKFGMSNIEDSEQTCIIVVEVSEGSGSMEMGILVDAVSEVLDISLDEIQDTPSFGDSVDTEFILGMAKTGGRVTILLNIEKIMTSREVDALNESKHGIDRENVAPEKDDEEDLEKRVEEELDEKPSGSKVSEDIEEGAAC